MNLVGAIKKKSLGWMSLFVAVCLLGCGSATRPTPPPQQQEQDPTLSTATDHYLKNYHFSSDWFTPRIPLWQEKLAPFKGKPNIHYLEIGVFEGRSALWMLENILTNPTSRMTCVDIFPRDLRGKFLANLKMSGFSKKATVIKGRSQIELRKLPMNFFDIIYIDGSHVARDVLADAVLSWELLKKGGVMIFDDYHLYEGDRPVSLRPQIAIDSFLAAFSPVLEVIHKDRQVILRKL